jgi:hypothetical protein
MKETDMGESILTEDGVSITVYECDVVNPGDKPWGADIVVPEVPGKGVVAGLTRKAVIDEGKAVGREMIRLRGQWANRRIRAEPKAEAEVETQLDLL